jgi:putative phosphoesterase
MVFAMSRIAFISDIHSNLTYLEKVLDKIDQDNVDRIYCLGDMIGYYDKPNEVIDLIIKKNISCIKGNHEKYILDVLNYNIENENIYRIKKQKKIITKIHLEFLNNLPDNIQFSLCGKKFYLTHSLPNDCLAYLDDLKKLDKNFISQLDYYCYGHTHIPLITYKYGACIINPGSIGQPRDFSMKPSYAIVDVVNELSNLNKVNVDYKSYSEILSNKNYSVKSINILKKYKNG